MIRVPGTLLLIMLAACANLDAGTGAHPVISKPTGRLAELSGCGAWRSGLTAAW